jgi:hypothetical protein
MPQGWLPDDPRMQRLAIAAWAVAAIGGTAAVWWLSSYVDTLTALVSTDRAAALELFRSRVLPALVVLVAIAVASGAILLRQGLKIVRASQDDDRHAAVSGARAGAPPRVVGTVLAVAGFLLAALPLVFISVVFWMLRQT